MKIYNLEQMIKGWFIGNFMPSAYKTSDVEVAIKKYCAGDTEREHFHKIATEITAVISGKIKMKNKIFSNSDIVLLKPNEITGFEALTDAVTVVVKIPGANNDKYLKGE